MSVLRYPGGGLRPLGCDSDGPPTDEAKGGGCSDDPPTEEGKDGDGRGGTGIRLLLPELATDCAVDTLVADFSL